MKNNSQEIVAVDTNATAFDAEGNELGTESGSIYALAPGETEIIDYKYFDTVGVDHVDVEIVPRATYSIPVIDDLDISATTNDRNVTLVVTNKGEYDAQSVTAYALFFDAEGKVCGYDYKYLMDSDFMIKPGETMSAQLNCETDFDHAEWYMKGSSDGSSTKVSDKVTDDDFTFQDYALDIATNDDSTSYLVVKSNADIPVGLNAFAVAFDADGKAIGAADGTIDVLAPGEQSFVKFYYTGVKGIDHVDYAIQYDDTPDYDPVLGNLELGQDAQEKGVVVTVTNTGDEAAESVQVCGLFFDGAGKLCGSDEAYLAVGDEKLEPGATLTKELKPLTDFATVECYLVAHGAQIG